MMAIATHQWFVGSNGNHFFDWGGYRYCVTQQTARGADKNGKWYAAQNGEVIRTGPYDSREAAQEFVEIHSGYRGREFPSHNREAV